jgi:hypothetical protein
MARHSSNQMQTIISARCDFAMDWKIYIKKVLAGGLLWAGAAFPAENPESAMSSNNGETVSLSGE